MLTSINRRNPGAKVARVSALCLLALAATLFQAREARAQWATSGANTTTTNSVGVGTTTPAQMFHVHSIGTWAGTRVTTAATGATFNDGVNFGYDDSVGAIVWNREATPIQFATSNTVKATLDAAGNFGIGTNAPGAKLTVSNNTGTLPSGNHGTAAQFAGPNGDIVRLLVDAYGGATSIDMRKANNTAAAPSALLGGNLIGQITWQGFGATSYNPASRLAISGFAAENYTDTAQGSYLTFATTPIGAITRAEVMRLDSTGNVGIGTTTPGVLNGFNFAPYISMHVQKAGGGAASIAIDSAHSSSGLVINDSSQPLDNRMWSISQGAGSGKLTFSTHTDVGNSVNRVVIDRAGKVGIGIATPSTALHVVGDITVSGNINAKYQDVAEWVPSTQKLSAGTVVILDVSQNNHVTASMKSYDTRVAGVVSAQPGISLGEAGEGKALVATTGRVRVKVDAARGAIRVGDILVTSDVPGVAMLSQPLDLGGVPIHRPGTIIGKALEPLASGTGEILVLLSLQ